MDTSPPNAAHHPCGYWLFQFSKGDSVDDVRRGHSQRWQARKEMVPGDGVVLWKPGTDAGIFGFGRLTSSAEKKAFWSHPTSVRWVCTRRLRGQLPKASLRASVLLRKVPVVRGKGRGGVFKLSAEQWREVQALTRRPGPIPKIEKAGARHYWLFQANPRGGDNLRSYLGRKNSGDNIWWRASLYRKPREHLREGDGVVFWQTRGNQPDAAGVYALGRLTGKLHHSGRGGWQAQVKLDRIRPIEDPISPQKLKTQEILRELPVLRRSGAMGSNFSLTKDQWYGFLSVWGSSRGIGKDMNPPIPEQVDPPLKRAPVAKTRKGSSIARARESYEIEWLEDALVKQYVVHMGHKGVTMGSRTKGRLRCDIYDEIHKNLIEAKAPVTRESIRMAIGELADYRRFVKPKYVSVLLPSRPEKRSREPVAHTRNLCDLA